MSIPYVLNEDTDELVNVIINDEFLNDECCRMARRYDIEDQDDIQTFAARLERFIDELKSDFKNSDGWWVDFDNVDYIEIAKFFLA